MAGPSDVERSAGAMTTMVFETLQGYGDDFILMDVDDDPYLQIIQTVNGRREPRAQELWPRHDGGGGVGFSFLNGYLRPEEISSLQEAEEASLSASRHAAGLAMEPRDGDGDDDERFAFAPPVPRLPPRAGRNPFEYSRAGLGGGRAYRHGTGGVRAVAPAAAAVVKKFEIRRYGEPGGDGGTSADSTACVICIQDYEAGEELTVVPCSGRHMFHQKCLAVWLPRKPLCPLCRHPLPAVAQ